MALEPCGKKRDAAAIRNPKVGHSPVRNRAVQYIKFPPHFQKSTRHILVFTFLSNSDSYSQY